MAGKKAGAFERMAPKYGRQGKLRPLGMIQESSPGSSRSSGTARRNASQRKQSFRNARGWRSSTGAGSALAQESDLQKIVQIVTDAGVELAGAKFGAFFYNVANDSGESYMLYTLSGAPAEAFAKFPIPRNPRSLPRRLRAKGS